MSAGWTELPSARLKNVKCAEGLCVCMWAAEGGQGKGESLETASGHDSLRRKFSGEAR